MVFTFQFCSIRGMNLRVFLCLLVSLTYTFGYTVNVSKGLKLVKCEKINETLHKCSSLYQVFRLLSTCCNLANQNCCDSTDVNIVESGSYALNISFSFINFMYVKFSSDRNSVAAEIKCTPNSNGSHRFDTGLAFVGVQNLIVKHLNFTGCGMKHNSSVFISRQFIVLRSALFILNSTDVSISNINVFDNNGVGILIYDTNGMVNITDSVFVGNKLKAVEKSEHFSGGGGIYIEFTNCTPGVPNCISKDNMHHENSLYNIDNCRFKNNAALYNFSENEPDQLANNVHVYFGVGGGLSVQLHGRAHNNSISISNNIFDSNEANAGGGLTVDIKQSASNNTVIISNSSFYNNSAHMYQGGGGAFIGVALYRKNDTSFNDSFVLNNCTFKNNHALKGTGGGIMGYASHEPGIAQATNKFVVRNSTFINNEAQYGSAIQINKEYHSSIVEGNMLTFIVDGCVFIENNLQSVQNTTFDSVGAVSSSGVNIQFRNYTRFSQNNSTALVVDGAFADFFVDSFTEFTENKGLHGGAILLIGESWIQVHPNCTLVFLKNTAQDYGGPYMLSCQHHTSSFYLILVSYDTSMKNHFLVSGRTQGLLS